MRVTYFYTFSGKIVPENVGTLRIYRPIATPRADQCACASYSRVAGSRSGDSWKVKQRIGNWHPSLPCGKVNVPRNFRCPWPRELTLRFLALFSLFPSAKFFSLIVTRIANVFIWMWREQARYIVSRREYFYSNKESRFLGKSRL